MERLNFNLRFLPLEIKCQQTSDVLIHDWAYPHLHGVASKGIIWKSDQYILLPFDAVVGFSDVKRARKGIVLADESQVLLELKIIKGIHRLEVPILSVCQLNFEVFETGVGILRFLKPCRCDVVGPEKLDCKIGGVDVRDRGMGGSDHTELHKTILGIFQESLVFDWCQPT